MAKNACWGIDVGQCALKAIKLRMSGGDVEAVSFDVIEHAKILSQPDADEQQLIRNALDKFLSRNDVRGDIIVVGVPGQSSFSRFIKLPPVELKKVPEIVKYEARQQIPFDLSEVIWDYQTMTMPTGGPAEIEVGIFAMKREIVQDYVNDFTQVKVTPDLVQMGPVALYNYLQFDRQDGAGATLLVDVGAENTSLVIADGYRVWIRNFPLGGNNFTQALVRAFKLTFAKAENLKRHAAESKYAREVFQAMRPVFSDLLTEIQRSIGFYTSLHRESRIERVLAMGNTFCLPGLQKFLSQSLGVDVVKVTRFNSLHGDQVTGAPVFKENTLSFGVAYGLALQGLGLGTITTSLLPPEILKEKEIRKKRPFVVGAAAVVVVGFGLMGYGSHRDLTRLMAGVPQPVIGSLDEPVKGVLSDVAALDKKNTDYRNQFNAASASLKQMQEQIDGYLTLFDLPAQSTDSEVKREYRQLWYDTLKNIWAVLPTSDKLQSYDPDTNEPAWGSFDVVEVTRIWGELVMVNEQGEPITSRLGGGPRTGSRRDTGEEGTPVMVFFVEGTIPNPTRAGADILTEKVVRPLQEKGYRVGSIQAPEYAKASKAQYPYEPEDPRTKKVKTPGGADGGAGGGEPGVDEQKKDYPPRPFRGKDYWFRLWWAVNLKDPNVPVNYSPTGGATDSEFGDDRFRTEGTGY